MKIIIAIDGHSSCGKSTFAKAIASELNLLYIDSGAMYRAVTLACMEQGLVREGKVDEDRLAKILKETDISFKRESASSDPQTFLNGVNVEEKVRSISVASNVSVVSKWPMVRKKLVSLQRAMGKGGGIVMEGRDIGTVVFPHANIKIFMTAAPEIRAERRYRELKGKGADVGFKEVQENLAERDRLDETRMESPLSRAPDAVELDNSFMTPGDQMEWFAGLLRKLNIT
jgi:CMP/dCMP kinase